MMLTEISISAMQTSAVDGDGAPRGKKAAKAIGNSHFSRFRHPRESGGVQRRWRVNWGSWIPAFAGMTN